MGKYEEQIEYIYREELKQSQTVMYIDVVKKIHDTGKGGDDRFISITANKVEYYKMKSPPHHDRVHLWKDLKKYVEKYQRVELYFEGDEMIRFESTSANNIGMVIKSLLVRVFTEEELTNMDIDVSQIVKMQYSAFTLLQRLIIQCQKSNNASPINQQFLNFMRYNLNHHTNDIDLSNLGDISPYIKAILSTITLTDDITSITIPKVNLKDNLAYYIIRKYINKEFQQLSHICISNPIDSEFNLFIENLPDLNSISFVGTNFDVQTLEFLKSKFENSPLKALRFSNAINENALEHFYKKTFVQPFVGNIYMLNLDYTNNIDFSILDNFHHLQSLSLRGVQGDAVEMIKTIAAKCGIAMKMLNLSSTEFSTNMTEFKLPNLIRLDIDNAKFKPGTFEAFMKTINERPWQSGLCLHMKNIDVDQNEFYNSMKDLPKNLIELAIGSPALNKETIDIITQLPYLKNLYLTNAFSGSEEEINTFAEKLSQLQTLNKFIFSNINTQISKIIAKLTDLQNLESLYFIKTAVYEEDLAILKTLVKDPTFKELIIDTVVLEDISPLSILVDVACKRDSVIQIVLPSDYLIEYSKTSEDALIEATNIRKKAFHAAQLELPEEFAQVNEFTVDDLKQEKNKWSETNPLAPLNTFEEIIYIDSNIDFPLYYDDEAVSIIEDIPPSTISDVKINITRSTEIKLPEYDDLPEATTFNNLSPDSFLKHQDKTSSDSDSDVIAGNKRIKKQRSIDNATIIKEISNKLMSSSSSDEMQEKQSLIKKSKFDPSFIEVSESDYATPQMPLPKKLTSLPGSGSSDEDMSKLAIIVPKKLESSSSDDEITNTITKNDSSGDDAIIKIATPKKMDYSSPYYDEEESESEKVYEKQVDESSFSQKVNSKSSEPLVVQFSGSESEMKPPKPVKQEQIEESSSSDTEIEKISKKPVPKFSSSDSSSSSEFIQPVAIKSKSKQKSSSKSSKSNSKSIKTPPKVGQTLPMAASSSESKDELQISPKSQPKQPIKSTSESNEEKPKSHESKKPVFSSDDEIPIQNTENKKEFKSESSSDDNQPLVINKLTIFDSSDSESSTLDVKHLQIPPKLSTDSNDQKSKVAKESMLESNSEDKKQTKPKIDNNSGDAKQSELKKVKLESSSDDEERKDIKKSKAKSSSDDEKQDAPKELAVKSNSEDEKPKVSQKAKIDSGSDDEIQVVPKKHIFDSSTDDEEPVIPKKSKIESSSDDEQPVIPKNLNLKSSSYDEKPKSIQKPSDSSSDEEKPRVFKKKRTESSSDDEILAASNKFKLKSSSDEEEEEEEKIIEKSKKESDSKDEKPKTLKKPDNSSSDDEKPRVFKKSKIETSSDEEKPVAPKKFNLKSSSDEGEHKIVKKSQIESKSDDEKPKTLKKPADSSSDEEKQRVFKKSKVESDSDSENSPKPKKFSLKSSSEDEQPKIIKKSKINTSSDEEKPKSPKKFSLKSSSDEEKPKIIKKSKNDSESESEKPKIIKKSKIESSSDDEKPRVFKKKKAFDTSSDDEDNKKKPLPSKPRKDPFESESSEELPMNEFSGNIEDLIVAPMKEPVSTSSSSESDYSDDKNEDNDENVCPPKSWHKNENADPRRRVSFDIQIQIPTSDPESLSSTPLVAKPVDDNDEDYYSEDDVIVHKNALDSSTTDDEQNNNQKTAPEIKNFQPSSFDDVFPQTGNKDDENKPEEAKKNALDTSSSSDEDSKQNIKDKQEKASSNDLKQEVKSLEIKTTADSPKQTQISNSDKKVSEINLSEKEQQIKSSDKQQKSTTDEAKIKIEEPKSINKQKVFEFSSSDEELVKKSPKKKQSSSSSDDEKSKSKTQPKQDQKKNIFESSSDSDNEINQKKVEKPIVEESKITTEAKSLFTAPKQEKEISSSSTDGETLFSKKKKFFSSSTSEDEENNAITPAQNNMKQANNKENSPKDRDVISAILKSNNKPSISQNIAKKEENETSDDDQLQAKNKNNMSPNTNDNVINNADPKLNNKASDDSDMSSDDQKTKYKNQNDISLKNEKNNAEQKTEEVNNVKSLTKQPQKTKSIFDTSSSEENNKEVSTKQKESPKANNSKSVVTKNKENSSSSDELQNVKENKPISPKPAFNKDDLSPPPKRIQLNLTDTSESEKVEEKTAKKPETKPKSPPKPVKKTLKKLSKNVLDSSSSSDDTSDFANKKSEATDSARMNEDSSSDSSDEKDIKNEKPISVEDSNESKPQRLSSASLSKIGPLSSSSTKTKTPNFIFTPKDSAADEKTQSQIEEDFLKTNSMDEQLSKRNFVATLSDDESDDEDIRKSYLREEKELTKSLRRKSSSSNAYQSQADPEATKDHVKERELTKKPSKRNHPKNVYSLIKDQDKREPTSSSSKFSNVVDSSEDDLMKLQYRSKPSSKSGKRPEETKKDVSPTKTKQNTSNKAKEEQKITKKISKSKKSKTDEPIQAPSSSSSTSKPNKHEKSGKSSKVPISLESLSSDSNDNYKSKGTNKSSLSSKNKQISSRSISQNHHNGLPTSASSSKMISAPSSTIRSSPPKSARQRTISPTKANRSTRSSSIFDSQSSASPRKHKDDAGSEELDYSPPTFEFPIEYPTVHNKEIIQQVERRTSISILMNRLKKFD